MAELLEIYDLQSNLIGVQERKDFYKEIREEYKRTKKITKKVRTVKLFLMNTDGRIYLQKRSRIKEENMGMYDKTIGGHIIAEDTANMTVIKECAEELWFPVAIATEPEFFHSVKVVDLKVIGLFRQIDYVQNFISEREVKIRNEDIYIFKQPQMASMYCGYYDGTISFKDGESSGVEVLTLDELKEDMLLYPTKFTRELQWLVSTYERFLVPLSQVPKLDAKWLW